MEEMLATALVVVLTHPATAQPPVAADPAPVTPRASRGVRDLLAKMRRISGRAILSGQCDDKYLPFIKRVSGKEPAIMGYDFNGLMPSQTGNVDAAKAIAWHRRGGIVTFQWHWISPDANGDF
jgi:mannan endo-1,4-beta-mannosidase